MTTMILTGLSTIAAFLFAAYLVLLVDFCRVSRRDVLTPVPVTARARRARRAAGMYVLKRGSGCGADRSLPAVVPAGEEILAA